ncbi:MAG: translation initiation factor IF-2 [Ruminococcaceae bacterium]|nr:translation initiation factor IF-2 [Oscillospiraceae bacterium]
MKISTLAKELKMKSGKELIEKLKELGFADIKSTQSTITEDAFNALFESIKPTYMAGVDIDDYLGGKAVIAEFSGEKAAPKPSKTAEKAEKKEEKAEQPKEEKKASKETAPAAPEKPAKEAKKAEPKTEAKPAAKTETKAEPKVEAKPEVKAEKKAEPKAEVKPEAKPDVKVEKKPAPAKQEPKQEAKPVKNEKPEVKPEPKPAVKEEVKKEEKPAPAAQNTESAQQKPQGNKNNAQKERVFTPPTQQNAKAQKPQKPQKPQPQQNQPQRPKMQGGVDLNAQIADRNANSKSRVVVTRGSSVDLSKYDEKFEHLASKAGKDYSDTRGGRVVDGRKKGGKFDKEKDKERIELEKLRKQQMEKARRLPVSVSIPDEITVSELASRLKISAGELIKKLFMLGVMANVNQTIDYDTAYLIADEMGAKVTKEVVVTIEEKLFEEEADDEKDLITRAPVVCVMGHVDHGKTSLLDAIRHTKVTQGEAGGITQHIGAYRVKVDGRDITFLDTPGHEAFTSMRARGAMATDIAILVVAADDGIMPQTVEAINHAKAAGVDIIVAINKMDKPTANPDQIMQALTQYELVPEEWGGDVICVPVSALTGKGIDDLLETVNLIADVKEYKANPDRHAKGVVIEAKLDRGRGPVATVLVQNGTLKIGDIVIAGTSVGRVKAMKDDNGRQVKVAGPSVPVEIDGLSEVPSAGDEFNAVENERMAKELAEQRKEKIKDEMFKANAKVNLEALFDSMNDGVKELNVIVKADVQGSAEAVKSSLLKLTNEEVKVSVIHSGAGGIVESDVMLAAASNAIIVGFNVRPDKVALDSAEKQKVDIRTYRIIYDCIEEIQAAMKGMLAPEFKESVIGHAEVRQAIRVPNVGIIAGCYITDGKVTRNCKMRILRDSILLCEDKLASLRRFKDDVKEVAQGYECGVGIENFNDIREGDVLEFFEMVEVER